MCDASSDPTTYDGPFEDSVDWARLRQIRDERIAAASERERRFGIPEREDVVRREADRIHHNQARRGAEYVTR